MGSSAAIMRAVDLATAAARARGPVALVGAPGTGRTHLARAIHGWSAREAAPFVDLSIAAIAVSRQIAEIFHPGGALERAGDGTLLLRDFGLLSDAARGAVVRAVEEGTYRSDGLAEAAPLRARILIAVDDGASVPGGWTEIEVPSLAERVEDIPALAAQFLAQFAEQQGVAPVGFTAEARRWLVEEPWPGNVRELRERVRQALRLAGGGAISIEALMLATEGDDIPSFKEAKRAFETRYVESLLRRCGGNISRAARLAKKDRKDFYDVIRRTGVDPQDFRS
ncbi:MAG: sigma 54-interacting transcriptional regulator [Myxococcota bacterium]